MESRPNLDATGSGAGVGEHEGAGAVGDLGVARREAGLAEEGRLLVAGDARHRHAVGQHPQPLRHAVDLRAHADLRQHLGRDPEEVEELRVPAQGAQVHEQRAAGVGRIGDVGLPAGEPPGEEGVDGPEGDLPLRGPAADPLLVVEEPAELGGREVGVEHEPGALADPGLAAGVLEPLALRRGAAVLPDDGPGERGVAAPAPERHRLPLVGDAHRGHVAPGDAGAGERPAQRGDGRVPDLLEVVLDPARLREVLGELLGDLALHRRVSCRAPAPWCRWCPGRWPRRTSPCVTSWGGVEEARDVGGARGPARSRWRRGAGCAGGRRSGPRRRDAPPCAAPRPP